MRQGHKERLPTLAGIPFVEAWAGMFDITPDVVSVMDKIESHSDF
ncbi:MAG: glycine/D-amino acid oxidase-like deaminating enzyme [Candidatus Azotimanducaceae bacterium]|jgi:glycine/D-amino acid oxidase-like deaminating enzyme